MADLSDTNAAQSVKIIGSDSAGVEGIPVGADASGNLKTVVNNASGAAAVNIQDGGNSITVDGTVAVSNFPAVQPVSDNSGSLTIDTPQLASTLGQKVMAASAAVVIASDQSVIPVLLRGSIDAGNSTVANLGIGGVYTGTWTDVLDYNMMSVTTKSDQASATDGLVIQWSNNGSTVHSDDKFTLAANSGKQFSFGRLSRYYRIVYTNGSVAQGSFSLQTLLSTGNFKASSHRVIDSIVDNDDAELVKSVIAGKSSSSGNYVNVAVDDLGRLVTSSLTGFGADFAFGDVATSALTRVLVNRTTYTEQTTNAQRSFASSSAADTAAGTGARTVKITYLDQVGAGPYTETVTLSGTARVNTVATNICLIESMEIVTAGSGGVNAGTVTLFTTPTSGGSAIGTIAVGDNQTFWTHHYVPTGKECNITGISCGHNGTTVGSGALFTVQKRDIIVANAVEQQVSDFVRLYGQTSTFARAYSSPIKVQGPSRLQMYVTPETASATVYRAAFDFFEP